MLTDLERSAQQGQDAVALRRTHCAVHTAPSHCAATLAVHDHICFTDAMQKILVIVNPASDGGATARFWPRARKQYMPPDWSSRKSILRDRVTHAHSPDKPVNWVPKSSCMWEATEPPMK